jgi:transposase
MRHDGIANTPSTKVGGSKMNNSNLVVRVGIDLGKNSFHLWGVDDLGQVVLRSKLARKRLLNTLAQMPACLIGMEACGGAHYWARQIAQLGHEVRLMAPQFVKAYVKGNKNDFNDAEGICEAVGRPNMRFVAVKTVEQQDLQAMHRIRQSAIKARTAQVNQIRGLLGEYGIVIAKGIGHVRRRVPEILEDGENGLTERFRALLSELYTELRHIDQRVSDYDRRIQEAFLAQEACQRLEAIEGVGVLSATAVVATFGDARQFGNGRQFSAALGLVPRQHSTGGEARLLGISKRGDRYIRTLLVHGARSVIQAVFRRDKDDKRSRWIKRLVAERGTNRAAVALANKNARILWALLSRGECYQASV